MMDAQRASSCLILAVSVVFAWMQPSALHKPPPRIEQGTVLTIQARSGLSMRFVHIAPGEFEMGDADLAIQTAAVRVLTNIASQGSSVPRGGLPIRKTKITKLLYFAETKTTTGQFCDFLNEIEGPERYFNNNKWTTIAFDGEKYNPKPGCADSAASTVLYVGAQAFCEWLSNRTGMSCRLPTESEWEFAARGPKNRKFAWGNSTDSVKLVNQKEPQSVHHFRRAATPEGLQGMFGIVGEWCIDWYAPSFDLSDAIDPSGPIAGKYKVIKGRGGAAWIRHIGGLHADGGGIYGFRVVIEVESTKDK